MARKRTGLYLRNGIYHCDFTVNSQRFRQTLETPDWREAKARFDDLRQRAKEGKLPACVAACTKEMGNGAIYFGDMREDAVSNGTETLPLAETLAKRGGFRFKAELGTKPRVWYLPPRR